MSNGKNLGASLLDALLAGGVPSRNTTAFPQGTTTRRPQTGYANTKTEEVGLAPQTVKTESGFNVRDGIVRTDEDYSLFMRDGREIAVEFDAIYDVVDDTYGVGAGSLLNGYAIGHSLTRLAKRYGADWLETNLKATAAILTKAGFPIVLDKETIHEDGSRTIKRAA